MRKPACIPSTSTTPTARRCAPLCQFVNLSPLQPWFHGKINRRAAEFVISKNGNGDGLFLLRDSTFSDGDYVLSMSSANQAYHFQVRHHRS